METYSMIGFEIVDLLPKHQDPQVLAEELDHVQYLHKAWSILGESGPRQISQARLRSCSRCLAAAESLPFHKTLSHTVPQCFQPVKGCFPRVLVIGFRTFLVAQ